MVADLPDGVVIGVDEELVLADEDGPMVVSSKRVHLEWSPNHCQSSWESQVQLSGFSANKFKCINVNSLKT